MKPNNFRKRFTDAIMMLIFFGIMGIYISLHAAIYFLETGKNGNYISSMFYGTADLFNGNLAIFPLSQQSLTYSAITIFIIFCFGCLWISELWFRRDMMDGKEKGTSDWNTKLKKFNKEYNEPYGYSKNNGVDNMILSNEISLGMNTRETRRNNNVLVVGGSGSGKSRFLCKPNILQANCSYVITDPAGELLASHGEQLKKMGYKLKVFNLVDMVHSNRYNPFHYIRDDLGVMVLINCLIKNTDNGKKGGDPFWEKSETALLQALIFYLVKYRPVEEQNFKSVLKLLSIAEVDENNPNATSKLDDIFDKIEREDPGSIAVEQYKIFKQGAGKTLKSILISTSVRLSHFNIREIDRLTKIDNLELGKIGDEKTALFVIIPAADDTYNYLVSMMYSQLFETLYYHAENECGPQKTLPCHVRFLLDEFANIGQIPNFEKKLATMRKYELSCTIILQSLSQLKALYKDDWQGIIGNCDTFLLLGSNEEETTKYVSEMLGTKTIRTRNISRNRRGGKVGNESNGRDARKLMMPDEIAKMDNKNCIIQIRGVNPFFATKYNLEKHPSFKLTGDYNKNNYFDITQHSEFLIRDKMSLKDIRQLIREAKARKIIGMPQTATKALPEAFKNPIIQNEIIRDIEPEEIEETTISSNEIIKSVDFNNQGIDNEKEFFARTKEEDEEIKTFLEKEAEDINSQNNEHNSNNNNNNNNNDAEESNEDDDEDEDNNTASNYEEELEGKDNDLEFDIDEPDIPDVYNSNYDTIDMDEW